jgi:hypothetical protein
MKTLFDVIDRWTMKWDRGLVETTLSQVAAPFYKRKLVFFLLEEFWDALELIDNPLEFMTEERKIAHVEQFLSKERNERAARAIILDIIESPEFRVTVMNVDEVVSQHPGWFEKYDVMN